jgi:hypothetical protein
MVLYARGPATTSRMPSALARPVSGLVRVLAPVAVALLVLLGDLHSSQAATSVPRPAATQLYWGAAIDGLAYGDGYVPYDMRGVTTFEAHAGKAVSIIPLGNLWQLNGQWNAFPTSDFDNIRNHGAIPLFTWQSAGDNPDEFRNAIITSGRYDNYIRAEALAAKAWGHPFFMRFDHEMDGWWYQWGEGSTSPGGPIVNGNQPGDYVRMYRHVHDIFTSVGATNATWVWSVNYEAISNQYPPLSQIYPGKAYVDWTGIDPYNFYPDAWLTFNQALTGDTTWISNTYQKVLTVAPTTPMMLAEFGSVEASTDGASTALRATARPAARALLQTRRAPTGLAPMARVTTAAGAGTVQPPTPANTKPAWLRDALLTQLVYNFPSIKAVVYYNVNTEFASMPIESSTAAQTAFAQGIASPLYATPRFSALAASPILPLAEAVAYLVPGADTYIASDAPSSTAGGSAVALSVSGAPSATHRAYLRFNLSSLLGKTIDQVVLQLTATTASTAASVDTLNVRSVGNNSWTEAGLSWSKPGRLNVGTSLIGTLVSPSTAGTVYTVTLPPSFVQASLAAGKLSVQLDDSGSDEFVFAAREATDTTQRPRLIVAYR